MCMIFQFLKGYQNNFIVISKNSNLSVCRKGGKRLWRKKKESRRAAQAALIEKAGIVLLLETVYRETGIVLNTKKVRLRRKSVSDIIAKERYNIPKGTPSFRCQYRGATLYGKKVQERLGNSACTEDNKVCS